MPTKKDIYTLGHIEQFWDSDIGKKILAFLFRLNESVRGLSIGEAETKCTSGPVIESLISFLDEIEKYIREYPPMEDLASRFGNPSFRQWHAHLVRQERRLHETLLGSFRPTDPSRSKDVILEELGSYLTHSFGHPERLDYGTGHELHFFVWLFCLDEIGFLSAKQDALVVLCIFKR